MIMNGRHEFTFGVERQFIYSGVFLFKVIFGNSAAESIIYKCAFGRLADCLIGGIKLCVACKRHSTGEKFIVW